MERANILKRIDLKRTMLGIPLGTEAWIPIDGYSVNTARSTAARINSEGLHGKISISEDYENKRLIVSRV